MNIVILLTIITVLQVMPVMQVEAGEPAPPLRGAGGGLSPGKRRMEGHLSSWNIPSK